METLELMLIGPIAYLVIRGFIKLWNDSVEQAYKDAENEASILLGQGQKVEAMAVMDRALIDYKRYIIRKVFGIKL